MNLVLSWRWWIISSSISSNEPHFSSMNLRNSSEQQLVRVESDCVGSNCEHKMIVNSVTAAGEWLNISNHCTIVYSPHQLSVSKQINKYIRTNSDKTLNAFNSMNQMNGDKETKLHWVYILIVSTITRIDLKVKIILTRSSRQSWHGANNEPEEELFDTWHESSQVSSLWSASAD